MNVLKIRHRYALGLAVALATSVLVVMGSIAHAISAGAGLRLSGPSDVGRSAGDSVRGGSVQDAEGPRMQALYVESAVVLGDAARLGQGARGILKIGEHAPVLVIGDDVTVTRRNRPEKTRQPQRRAAK